MFYKYPHTDLNQANLDWLVNRIKELEDKVQALEQAAPIDYAVPPQFDSWPEHSTITQRQLAVLDEAGQVFGGSVNINDVMLKPRRCASGAIGVFDDRGNLIPTSLDEHSPVITLADLAVVAEDSSSGDADQTFHLANGLLIHAVRYSLNLDSMAAAGSLYRQSVNINWTFPTAFADLPFVFVSPPVDVNTTCWCGAAVYTTTGVSRLTMFSHQSASIIPIVTILAVGRKELDYV